MLNGVPMKCVNDEHNGAVKIGGKRIMGFFSAVSRTNK